MNSVLQVLRMAWGFFEIECPFLGISFGSLFLGVMVMKFSITLIKPILGIGSRAVHGAENSIRASSKKKNYGSRGAKE